MFVEAIEKASSFTRPIHSIKRNYASKVVHPGAATLFFVNSEGWALTCRHVARLLPIADQIAANYKKFKDEFASGQGKIKEKKLCKELERKYKYTKRSIVELRNKFVNCAQGKFGVEVRFHNKLDVALIKFNAFERLLCEKFPVFVKDSSGLKQGKFLCRLGFPFPEFTNFTYNETLDKIEWSSTGQDNTPRFPIEGMVTRHLPGESNKIIGFEMSTPGLRGQSGGPAFDADGKIWGMQSATGHLDLNFDIDQEVVRDGLPKRVQNSPFLHVGHCIHVDILKSFMQEHKVHFNEE
ncbi:MAG: trypsin-like peptidase domain-containing protein [bacterium]